MIKKIIIVIILWLFTLNIACSKTREPAVAGQWYPSDEKELTQMLDGFFQNVKLDEKAKKVEPFGIVSPHAGFVYSGQVAAYGYSLIKDKKYDTIILLGPSHHFLDNVISIYDGDFYKTPMGKVPIDKKIVSEILKENDDFVFYEYIHRPEHSLESQIPFLQYQLQNFKIVPIITSTRNFDLLDELSNTLCNIVEKNNKKILFVISTDMSHFHDYFSAKLMDNQTLNLIQEKKWDILKKNVLSGKSELCGYYAFYTFTKIMEYFKCDKNIVLKYVNSGDAIGDTTSTRVVGYCSIVFPKARQTQEEELLSSDKEYLLDLARKSIEYYLENQKILKPEKPKAKILNEDRAVFVTLNKNHNLRGCIGQLMAQMPLYQAITEVAVSAAVNDYRFNPVNEDELEQIKIEISVLSPLQKISDISEIKMGIDGVWIKKNFHSGVYLPQVATETGWDKKTFLESLCAHKAGLSKDAYLDEDTEIYIFQVEKFSE